MVLLAGQAEVDCTGQAEATGTGQIYSAASGMLLPGSGIGCDAVDVCDVRFAAVLAPGEPGYDTADESDIFTGNAAFSYTDADQTGPSVLVTNPVTFDNTVQIPSISPTDTWSSYLSKLQALGIVHIRRDVLSNADANASLPPGAVEQTDPAPGTTVNPETDVVTVTTNPDNMRVPDLGQPLLTRTHPPVSHRPARLRSPPHACHAMTQRTRKRDWRIRTRQAISQIKATPTAAPSQFLCPARTRTMRRRRPRTGT